MKKTMETDLTKKERYLLKRQQKEQERLKKERTRKIKRAAFILLPLLLIIGGGIFIWLNYSPGKNQTGNIKNLEKPKITVFYSPTCSCCMDYIPYLKRNGFEVDGKATQDMLSIKEKYQISSEIESCHTAVVGDYFIEGHVPVEAIEKLLVERPEIDGISLPGMPAGSPGMGGVKTAPFKIYNISNGQFSEFLSI